MHINGFQWMCVSVRLICTPNTHSSILLTFLCFCLIWRRMDNLCSIIYVAHKSKSVSQTAPPHQSLCPPPSALFCVYCDEAISLHFEEQHGAQEIASGQNIVAAERCFPWRGLRPLFLSSQLPFVIYITAQLLKTGKCTSFEDRLWCIALLIFSLFHCKVLDE